MVPASFDTLRMSGKRKSLSISLYEREKPPVVALQKEKQIVAFTKEEDGIPL